MCLHNKAHGFWLYVVFCVNSALLTDLITYVLGLQSLINKVGELKRQLALERRDRLAVETEVRQELCEYFSNMMVEAQAEWEWVP